MKTPKSWSDEDQRKLDERKAFQRDQAFKRTKKMKDDRIVMIGLLHHHKGSFFIVDPHLELDLTGIIPENQHHLGYFGVQVLDTDLQSLYKTHMNSEEFNTLLLQLSASRKEFNRYG